MDKVNYETYDTDAVYDDMDGKSTAEEVISQNIDCCFVIDEFTGQGPWSKAPAKDRESKWQQKGGYISKTIYNIYNIY